MNAIRPAAVAGLFYPGDSDGLRQTVGAMLAAAGPAAAGKAVPKAIIVPHAGYVYSGPIAASAYARLVPARQRISRVVLLGPAHRVAFSGIAASAAEAFETPLGRVSLDRETAHRLVSTVPGVIASDTAHAQDHAIEVHLPFLQTLFDRFTLLPMIVGGASPDLVAQVIDAVWGGPETLIVISSDLSHYLDYAAAKAIDRQTCEAIERLDGAALAQPQACGRIPVAGLLTMARQRGLSVETLDLRNSGDTAGTRDQVVGYGAWVFCETAAGSDVVPPVVQAALPGLARQAIQMYLAGGIVPTLSGPPPSLAAPGACFVTLKRDGVLRGCIGSAIAWRPLAVDLIDNAIKAATQDPRFPAVTSDELNSLALSVSLLTPPQPIVIKNEADLLAQLRPGIDGLIIEDGEQKALFLPAVWTQIPRPDEFLGHLKRKAGMTADHWSDGFRAARFTAIEIAENRSSL